VSTLNQHEREPLTVEDQTVQIFAATNGFLDRLNVERVPEFLLGLTERMHAQHGELRAKIAGGDWSDEVQEQVRAAVDAYAGDFGYDLDEEGQPLEDGEPLPAASVRPPGSEPATEPEQPVQDKQPEGAAA
jgi:F-type H+-transporting ATPase subunit alpha